MHGSRNSLGQAGVIIFLAVLLAAPTVQAADGRDLTKSKCKSCHTQGSAGGTMTPLSKTQNQWERFFKKARHEKQAPGALKDISAEELELIRQYLIDHAADSPHPETCG